MDVVHDLGLEEGLSCVVHDFIAQFGLCNVLPELLDAGAAGLLGAVQVDDLICVVLGSDTVLHLSHELLYNLKLSPEECILGHVHLVPVSLEDGHIDARNSLDQTFVRGRDLELFEETGDDTASGGPGESDLVGDNDGGVDVGPEKRLADDVKIGLFRGSGVTDWDPPVDQTRELLLETLHNLTETLQLLNLNLGLLFVDVNNFQLATIGTLPSLHLF